MMTSEDGIARGYLSSADVERLFPARVARIARGNLTYTEKGRILVKAGEIDPKWRGGKFNGIEHFHFRFPKQSATMAAFLLREGFHRLVPESLQAPTPAEVEAEWQRLAAQREAILGWARAKKALSEVVQTYRFERRRGAYSQLSALRGGKDGRADRSVGRRCDDLRRRLHRMGRTRAPRVVLALCTQ
jgi:hypothetical protein